MQAIYLVYPYDFGDRPLAAFDALQEAERFARHNKWARRDDGKMKVEAVPYFGEPWVRAGSSAGFNARETSEAEWRAADNLWDPGESGTYVDESGEACNGPF